MRRPVGTWMDITANLLHVRALDVRQLGRLELTRPRGAKLALNSTGRFGVAFHARLNESSHRPGTSKCVDGPASSRSHADERVALPLIDQVGAAGCWSIDAFRGPWPVTRLV